MQEWKKKKKQRPYGRTIFFCVFIFIFLLRRRRRRRRAPPQTSSQQRVLISLSWIQHNYRLCFPSYSHSSKAKFVFIVSAHWRLEGTESNSNNTQRKKCSRFYFHYNVNGLVICWKHSFGSCAPFYLFSSVFLFPSHFSFGTAYAPYNHVYY